MRALTDVETQTLFTKLANYTGRSLNQLIAPSDSSDENDRHVFRLHESRVYYVRLSLANLATSVARDNLLSLGTCVGKFTKTGKFRLHITALDVIAPHARYKLWVKQNGEMPFLYGGNIVKAHVGRWSEECPEHSGVVILSMDDTPLGFGVTARSTAEARKLDPTAVVAFRQGDVGEYLREVCDFSCNLDYISLTWRRKRPCSPLESLLSMLYSRPHSPSAWHSFSHLKK
jgi:60S ribosome subunit biogenesis protein NIP7